MVMMVTINAINVGNFAKESQPFVTILKYTFQDLNFLAMYVAKFTSQEILCQCIKALSTKHYNIILKKKQKITHGFSNC